MSEPTIEEVILRNLYKAKFTSEGQSVLPKLRDKEGWDEKTFRITVDRMVEDDLICSRVSGGLYEIRTRGVLLAEQEDLVDKELVMRNKQARFLTLEVLQQIRNERGPSATKHYTEISKETGVDKPILLANVAVLENLGWIEDSGAGLFKITSDGVSTLEQWRDLKATEVEFEKISAMQPQSRGQAFQKLFAKAVELQGWIQREHVQTSHEEIDVIVSKGREYYLIECEWLKDSSEANLIREIYAKIENRAVIHGIAVSMSGFSKGAVKQATRYSNKRPVLLFGSEDAKAIICGQRAFDELLDEKLSQLVYENKIVFS